MTTPNELIKRLSAIANTEANEVADALNEAADLLQSQAERIRELEGQLDDATAAARSDQMIAETAQAAASRLLTERDALHAQLAEIAASDPVAWAISYDGVTPYTLWHEGDGALLDCEVERQGGMTQKMPLFTRPMPAQPIIGSQAIHDAITVDPTLADCSQDVNAEIEKVEPVAIALNTGTRQAVKWLQNIPHGEKLYTRPMPVQSAGHCLWARNGHEPCQHVKPMQDVNAELVEALQCAKNSLVAFKLMPVPSNAWEDHDEANLEVVNAALSKYKGAK